MSNKLIVTRNYNDTKAKRRELAALGYEGTSLRHMRSPTGDTVIFVWLTDNVQTAIVGCSFDEVEGLDLLPLDVQGYVRLRLRGSAS